MKRFSKIILALLLIVVAWVPMAQSSTYKFTTIDIGHDYTEATGINDQGQITGYYRGEGSFHGFLFSGGGYTTFDMAGVPLFYPYGIDDQGRIVGIYENPWDHGFIYDRGNFTTFDIPITIGEAAIPETSAYGVSGQGEIVGRSCELWPQADGWHCYNDHGFIRNVDGGYTFFDLGSNFTMPFGINDQGQIVGLYLDVDGFHGFLREKNGGYINVDFPGAEQTHPFGINDNGQIVGLYFTSQGNTHSFIYEGGSFTTFDVPGALYTQAMGINNQGQIVGVYTIDNSVTYGFLASLIPEAFPDISASPTFHDFGNVVVGSSAAAQTFTIFNTGTADLIIGTIEITGFNASEFLKQNDNCSGHTIAAPSGTCTVKVVFSPSSVGPKSATLSIPSNDPATQTLNVPLSGTAILDIIPPTGSITINSGATYTNSTSVILTLTCTDTESGCAKMRFSNDNSVWSAWETFTTSKNWTLTSGNGQKTVYVQFQDAVGNISTSYSAMIMLQRSNPDLIVSSLIVPTKAGAGTTVNITDTTKNRGSGGANASITSFYLSTNTALDLSDTLLGDISVPALGAGASSTGTTSVIIPSGIPPGKYYIIAKADAQNSIVETNENNNMKYKAIIIGSCVPSAPGLVSPANGSTGVSISPTVDWTDVPGATSYEVWICTDANCIHAVAGSASATSSQYTVPVPWTLTQNTTYWWHVRAKTTCGQTSWSGIWSFQTGIK